MTIIILMVSVFSYLLKAIPLLSRRLVLNPSGVVAKTVEYTVCFIMGGIIINVALGNVTYSMLINDFKINYIIAILAIILAFIITRLTGIILMSLLISLGFFIVVMIGFS